MEKEDKGKTVQRCKEKREKEGKNITAKGEKTEYTAGEERKEWD